MTAHEDSVLLANTEFYAAFASRDPDAMDRLWAREHLVACIHPGWHALHGRDEVLASWRAILDNPESPRVIFLDARALVLGDTALVTCTEKLPEAELCATNVFTLERGEWKIVHHQAGPLSRRAVRRVADPETLN